MEKYISKECKGETCFCGRPAYHKLAEAVLSDDPLPGRHEMTSYLCCLHFGMVMGRAALKSCESNGHLVNVSDSKTGYKLIPMSEITDKARELAVAWGDNMKDDFIAQKHKLASDFMNYAISYHNSLELRECWHCGTSVRMLSLGDMCPYCLHLNSLRSHDI